MALDVEDDLVDGRRPLPGLPVDTALERQLGTPDQVNPQDLVVVDPSHPYGLPLLGTSRTVSVPVVNPAPSRLGTAPDAIPLHGRQELTPEEQARVAEIQRKMGLDQPAGMSSSPDVAREAGPAAAAAPGTPPLAAPAPIDVGPTITTDRVKLSSESKAGQQEQLAALEERKGIVEQTGADKKKAAQETANEVTAQAIEKESAAEQDKQDRAAARAKLDAAYAERDRIIADAEKTSLRGYWTDKPAGAEVLAILGTALGTKSAAMLGGRNFAQENLDNAIARDTAAKQDKLRHAIAKAGMVGERAHEAYEFGMQEINLRKAVLLEKLADHKAVLDAQHGVDSAGNETLISANDLRLKGGALREEFGHFADTKVHTSNELQQRSRLAQAEAQAAGGTDPLALRGTDGQPVVTGTDASGRPVYARAHSEKASETIAAFRDKYPTAMQNLQRLQQLASGSATDRAKAVASGEADSLRHDVALTMATLESEGRAPSARLILVNEQMLPKVSIATIRDPAKVFGQVRTRMVDRAANIISSQTNANAQVATRLANEWAAGVAGRTQPAGEGKRIKYRMADGQVVDAIQRPNGAIEALQ
jgi:hypothetical protein